MKRVLRRLGFINKDDIVLTKGKVACEISACDEIIVNFKICKSIEKNISKKIVNRTNVFWNI